MDEIRRLPANYSLLWLKLAFKLLKKNYGVCFLTSLVLMVFTTLALKLPPYVAAIVNPLMFAAFGIGCLEMGRKMVKEEEVRLQTIFVLFNNSEKLRQLSSYFILVTFNSAFLYGLNSVLISGLGGLGKASEFLGSGGVFFSQLLLGLIFFLLFGFSLPLMYFKNLRLKETIRWNVNYIFANIKVFILFSVLWFVALMASILLLLVPLFFIFGPLLVPVPFIVYISLFDNFEPDRFLSRQTLEQTLEEQEKEMPQRE